jgi:hypothetical protein
MATKTKKNADDADAADDVDVIDLVEGPGAQGAEKLEELRDEASQAAGRTMLREVPYAAVGLGRVVTDAVRNVDAAALPERLRRSPAAIASGASALGTKAKVTYLALAARGRAAGLASAGDEAAAEVAGRTQDAVDATREGVEDATDAAREGAKDAADGTTAAAGAAGGRVKAWLGKGKDVATRSSKSTSQEDASGSDDADDLEERTVAELRDQASELDIEGRAGLRKQELIEAIRDAT